LPCSFSRNSLFLERIYCTLLKRRLFLLLRAIEVNVRGKTIPETARGGPYGCETSRFQNCLNNRLTAGRELVSLTHRPADVYPQDVSWYRGWVDPRAIVRFKYAISFPQEQLRAYEIVRSLKHSIMSWRMADDFQACRLSCNLHSLALHISQKSWSNF
jgi:hypothetical protein